MTKHLVLTGIPAEEMINIMIMQL